jgi:rhodanese-related sulfurtransferase
MAHKKKKPVSQDVLTVIVIAALVGGLSAFFVVNYMESAEKDDNTKELIKEWHDAEVAVHVSPHHIRKGMGKGDDSFVLVDLRSHEEYLEEHIRLAVSIPAYKDRDHSDYGAKDRIVGAFTKLIEENPDKDIIVYCYSIPCMTGRKIGKMLADNGIYVKQLGVGWNEWRYFWTLWNHPHEWKQTKVEDYVWKGEEPGEPFETPQGSGCPLGGEFGC